MGTNLDLPSIVSPRVHCNLGCVHYRNTIPSHLIFNMVWNLSETKRNLRHWGLGLYSLRRRHLISIGIPIINLRRSSDRLRFIIGIPILVRCLLSEKRPYTKLLPFCRRHFQMHFIEWKCMNFTYWDFTKVCSSGLNEWYSIIGLDNGLAPTRWQAIVWTNVKNYDIH